MATISSRTIADVQADLEAALEQLSRVPLPPGLEGLKVLVPNGMTTSVSLRYAESDRQIRRTADASYWNPESCKAVIQFRPAERTTNGSERRSQTARLAQTSDPLADLVKTLDQAERDPRFPEFVGIKSFRDRYLDKCGTAWALDRDRRHDVLVRAIEQRLVLRSSVPNPKSPSFPTTSIRVNREHPEVKRILGMSAAERSPFAPVAIPGGDLSSTVLSERR